VQTLVPIISPPPRPLRLSASSRLLAAALAAGCLLVLVMAALLPPSPEGLGTHQQLHFGRCEFLQRSGIPCPTCGMTTSFSYFVRGRFVASLYVQPFAAVLALACAMLAWAGGYVAISGRPLHRLLRLAPARYYLAACFGLAVLAWAWKIFIHVYGIDGWH